METKKFIYYKDGDMWVGWLEEYSDYRTHRGKASETSRKILGIYMPTSAATLYLMFIGLGSCASHETG
jgi:hypothetical protein